MSGPWNTKVIARVIALGFAVPGIIQSPLAGQNAAADDRGRIATAIRGQQEVRVQTNGMFVGVISLRSPHVDESYLRGTTQSGTFMGQTTYAESAIPLYQVTEVQIRNGSHWLEYGGIGALAGFVLVAAVQESCQRDAAATGTSCNTALPIGAIYAIGIGGFGLAGAIGGALYPRWTTAYSRGTPRIVEPYGARGIGRTALIGLRLRFGRRSAVTRDPAARAVVTPPVAGSLGLTLKPEDQSTSLPPK